MSADPTATEEHRVPPEKDESRSEMDIEIPEPGDSARPSEGTVKLRVRRQDDEGEAPYWQYFEVPRYANMNVVELLMEIRKNPVDAEGNRTTPVAWSMMCLEEVCGICTMVINGHVRQSCSTLVDDLEQPITLEPMRKFPVRRDLVIDRTRLFDAYRRVKAWVPVDGTHDLGPGPRIDESERAEGYWLSRCISCGACVDACPQPRPPRERTPRGRFHVHRRGPDLVGPAHEHPSQRRPPGEGAVRGPHGPRWHRRLRQVDELRAGVPQGDPPHGIDRLDEPPDHAAPAGGLAQGVSLTRGPGPAFG